jgi:TetR/AcrR family transcriptional regulator, mexJK operon transcriptional repressor
LSAAEPIAVARARPLGRPFDETKRDVIVAAAFSAFFEHGYGGTSIEEIARRAGVSKVTVYNRFGDKQALFSAAIASECLEMETALRLDVDQPQNLRDHLVRFGEAMLEFLGRPELIRFENMLGGEMERHPELGALFLDAGPRRMKATLAKIIEAGAQRREIVVDDPITAAEMLAGMLKGFVDLERRFAGHPVAPVTRERITYAVDAFLRAHAPA